MCEALRCVACNSPLDAIDGGAFEAVCSCGVVQPAAVFNEHDENRYFEDGDEDKKRADADTREDDHERAVCSSGWAQTRVNQAKMLLSHLHSDEPGSGFLSKDEVSAALATVRAAAERHAAAPGSRDTSEQTASAIFWAIAVAQDVAARRPGGWVVEEEKAAASWSLDALHKYLSHFASESHATAEVLGNATRAGGGVSNAASLLHAEKRRRLDVRPLGDAAARRAKLATLDVLLREEGGLHPDVLAQGRPRVRAPLPPSGRARAVLARRGAGWEERVRQRDAQRALGRTREVRMRARTPLVPRGVVPPAARGGGRASRPAGQAPRGVSELHSRTVRPSTPELTT